MTRHKETPDVLGALLGPAKQIQLRYDYSQIEAQHRETVKVAATVITREAAQMKTSVITIGERLQEVKDLLPHGQFGDWCATEFSMSDRMARHMMSVARTFAEKSELVSILQDTSLYLLASPSTPEAARQEVETAAAAAVAGQAPAPNVYQVREIIRKAQDDEKTKRLGMTKDQYARHLAPGIADWLRTYKDRHNRHWMDVIEVAAHSNSTHWSDITAEWDKRGIYYTEDVLKAAIKYALAFLQAEQAASREQQARAEHKDKANNAKAEVWELNRLVESCIADMVAGVGPVETAANLRVAAKLGHASLLWVTATSQATEAYGEGGWRKPDLRQAFNNVAWQIEEDARRAAARAGEQEALTRIQTFAGQAPAPAEPAAPTMPPSLAAAGWELCHIATLDQWYGRNNSGGQLRTTASYADPAEAIRQARGLQLFPPAEPVEIDGEIVPQDSPTARAQGKVAEALRLLQEARRLLRPVHSGLTGHTETAIANLTWLCEQLSQPEK